MIQRPVRRTLLLAGACAALLLSGCVADVSPGYYGSYGYGSSPYYGAAYSAYPYRSYGYGYGGYGGYRYPGYYNRPAPYYRGGGPVYVAPGRPMVPAAPVVVPPHGGYPGGAGLPRAVPVH